MKKVTILLLLMALFLAGCSAYSFSSDADVASKNLSTAADNFKITRRIVFYNGITNEYILEIMGKCSLGNYDSSNILSVTCKTGDNSYKKHFLGLSDNVTYFAEQIDGAGVDTYHYDIIFKPSTIIPNIKIK